MTTSFAAATEANTASAPAIYFIDASLSDLPTLLAGLPPGADVQLIPVAQDGLQFMADALAGRSGLDAIHILSHGASGSLQLGSTTLNAATLASRAADLVLIGQSLNDDGDILLYGCNVAAGEVGAQFVGTLAQATGADVTASDDLTGAQALGGDWVLEGTSGQVDAAGLQVVAYRGVLYAPGDSVIDLGASGKLIAPVQVEGKWYYFWDRSGDGTNQGEDITTHDVLDGIFNQDINGTVGGGGNTTETYRYATINGVRLALPTDGLNGADLTAGGIGNKPGTAYSFAGAANDPTANSNATYDDLLAIWDAKNGTITGLNQRGTPSDWLVGSYWSATPSPAGHATVATNKGSVANTNDTSTVYVALQVLVPDTPYPTVSSVAITSATGIAASTLNAGDVVSVTVTMSKATTVTGTPNLALNIGGTTVQAAYASGTGTTALVFNYTILAAQTDANGISIAANALSLNSGTLANAAGDAAVLTHALVADNTGYLVDTTAPTVTHTSAAYTSVTNTLVLTGTNFNTLLETSETASTNIRERLN